MQLYDAFCLKFVSLAVIFLLSNVFFEGKIKFLTKNIFFITKKLYLCNDSWCLFAIASHSDESENAVLTGCPRRAE